MTASSSVPSIDQHPDLPSDDAAHPSPVPEVIAELEAIEEPPPLEPLPRVAAAPDVPRRRPLLLPARREVEDWSLEPVLNEIGQPHHKTARRPRPPRRPPDAHSVSLSTPPPQLPNSPRVPLPRLQPRIPVTLPEQHTDPPNMSCNPLQHWEIDRKRNALVFTRWNEIPGRPLSLTFSHFVNAPSTELFNALRDSEDLTALRDGRSLTRRQARVFYELEALECVFYIVNEDGAHSRTPCVVSRQRVGESPPPQFKLSAFVGCPTLVRLAVIVFLASLLVARVLLTAHTPSFARHPLVIRSPTIPIDTTLDPHETISTVDTSTMPLYPNNLPIVEGERAMVVNDAMLQGPDTPGADAYGPYEVVGLGRTQVLLKVPDVPQAVLFPTTNVFAFHEPPHALPLPMFPIDHRLHEVVEIIGERHNKRLHAIEFLCRFLGFDDEENEWLTELDLSRRHALHAVWTWREVDNMEFERITAERFSTRRDEMMYQMKFVGHTELDSHWFGRSDMEGLEDYIDQWVNRA